MALTRGVPRWGEPAFSVPDRRRCRTSPAGVYERAGGFECEKYATSCRESSSESEHG
jgi:hypothetical protein